MQKTLGCAFLPVLYMYELKKRSVCCPKGRSSIGVSRAKRSRASRQTRTADEDGVAGRPPRHGRIAQHCVAYLADTRTARHRGWSYLFYSVACLGGPATGLCSVIYTDDTGLFSRPLASDAACLLNCVFSSPGPVNQVFAIMRNRKPTKSLSPFSTQMVSAIM